MRAARCAFALSLAIAITTVAGCVLNDEVCGPNMTYDETAITCVCAGNAIEGAHGCTPCADDEIVKAGKCACPDGMAKSDGVCKATDSGLGKACSATEACGDPAYPHCADAGYCTKTGCSGDADCGGDWRCATWASTPYCQRFPSNMGASCNGPADCANGEATFCEAFQTKKCTVSACGLSPDTCPVGFDCCDLSRFGVPDTLCVAEGACPSAP